MGRKGCNYKPHIFFYHCFVLLLVFLWTMEGHLLLMRTSVKVKEQKYNNKDSMFVRGDRYRIVVEILSKFDS